METGVTPLVSVLLASYNHEKYVEAAVRSVMEQQGVDFELIVIDDGSPDHSPEILDALQQELGFRYVHRPNKGLVATMNELLSMAKGKYFCSFASDDVMPQGRLAAQCDFLDAHPESVACFGQIKLMDADGVVEPNVDPRYSRACPSVSFEELVLGKKELHGCSEMIRTAVFKEMGGYNDQIKTEDFAMFCALSSRYGDLPVLPDVCCHYRIHGSNMHYDLGLIYPETIKTIKKFADPALARRAVRIWKSHWFSALAYSNKKEALKRLPELWSFSTAFFKRFPKLFIPKSLLKF